MAMVEYSAVTLIHCHGRITVTGEWGMGGGGTVLLLLDVCAL